jgi:hypothetical protein
MTIYYTAKDIEEMAARGVRQLELGPGITLTDFARETAKQLDIVLVKPDQKSAQTAASAPSPAVPRSSAAPVAAADKYNKPAGCQHSTSISPITRFQAATPPAEAPAGGDSTTVNRLIDLMGKVIKRGE